MRDGGVALVKSSLMHVHLENLSTKPPIFRLTPDLVRETQRNHRDLARKVRFSVDSDLERLAANLRTVNALVTSSDVLRHPRFPLADMAVAAPYLRFVHVIGAGVDALLPLDWLPQGVRLTNNSGVHVAKAREFIVMALLALNSRLPEIVWNQRHARWNQVFTPAIRGKRLAVIGLGDMGRAAVAAGRMLGLEIVGVRRSGKSVPGVSRVYPPARLRTALKRADFVVAAAPLTPETRALLDRAALEAAKPGIGLVNVGRAGLLDHDALVDLLKTGHVSGAILDVFASEPLPAASPLWSAPNLIINPHVSSDDLDAYMRETMNLVCRNLRLFLAGRRLSNVVDPARGY
jgi:phosphoglycerate dehydrogenase-like enzyme